MKFSFSNLVLIVLITLAGACQDVDLFSPSPTESQRLTFETALGTGLVLPEGATTAVDGGVMTIEVPAGYEFIGSSHDGTYDRPPTLEVTCTCLEVVGGTTGTGGCSPGAIGGEEPACIITDCTTCKKTVKSSTAPNGTQMYEDYTVIRPEHWELLEDFAELDGMRLAPGSLMHTAPMISMLQALNDNLLPGEPGEESKQIFVNLLGQVVVLEVPMSTDDVSLALTGGGKATCSCLKGKSCPLESKLIAKWCDASNCASCKMTVSSIINSDGEEAMLTVSDSGIISVQ